MSQTDINKMDFKQLRNKVQELEDTIALMKRKYEDILFNLDDGNFSGKFIKEKEDMKTEISITAEGIKTMVSKTDLNDVLTDYSTFEQTAEKIQLAVNSERTYMTNLLSNEYTTKAEMHSEIAASAENIQLSVSAKYQLQSDADEQYQTLNSKITVEENRISSIIQGDYTSDLFSDYFTGIEISPNAIKMIDGSAYSIYNSDGLRFYDSSNQKEGWAIEPDSNFGGALRYYINNSPSFSVERNSGTTMELKALNSGVGMFVVDLTNSGNKEVKFVGLSERSSDESPYIYANEKLLATQEWVLENVDASGSGTATAVFG